MYAVTSMPLVSRTRATLRSAEFGFLGVVVYTRVQTPRRCGLPFSAGVLVLPTLSCRPLRTSCEMVGTAAPSVLRRVASLAVSWLGARPKCPVRPTHAVGRVARARLGPARGN